LTPLLNEKEPMPIIAEKTNYLLYVAEKKCKYAMPVKAEINEYEYVMRVYFF
jgi:hypothetical protein